MSYARRVDNNHKAIVEALRATGWRVEDTSRVGRGFPDLVCSKANRTILVEVKGKGGKLTEDQRAFMAMWQAPVHIVTTVDDVLAL